MMDSDNKRLFFVSSIEELNDFLSTDASQGRHIYCIFSQRVINPLIQKKLERQNIPSISFMDGHTLYPSQQEEIADVNF
ncbi:hypothetical protein DZ860_21150 [Vibrio sinensis]|uniref:Uncharacterized protein n=1 Tax=Vibrio sinensis TaxID=2302434 RepID=A0A3A6QDJ3_9VIBR|nr:hypothetical protein [Vibrio sinensis]RJX65869.1 hypothetical protein DZ860_21150 [Vibrio sinensis]